MEPGSRSTGTADDNIIQGNVIGTTANGLAALGNRFGIFNAAAAGTLIGGTRSRCRQYRLGQFS